MYLENKITKIRISVYINYVQLFLVYSDAKNVQIKHTRESEIISEEKLEI